ncbi:MAG: RES domain-containing protein, partial [Terriglobales bacterium]
MPLHCYPIHVVKERRLVRLGPVRKGPRLTGAALPCHRSRSIADFTTPATLKLVDLRNPRERVSPFLLVDADDIGRMRNDLPFLERLGTELTRPVLPQSAAIDYTPSQYLCEFIKKCGYQGVIYSSSVSDGMNLALFD